MSLEIEIGQFTGPFDLLLKLIEKQKIDIYDVKIEDITNDYLKEVEKLNIESEELSEFIYIASILISIKARKLLPTEEEDKLEEDFLAYLIEYKRIKSVEEDFRYLEENSRKFIPKYGEDLAVFASDPVQISHDIEILAHEFKRVMEKFSKEKGDVEEKFKENYKLPDVNDYLEKIRKSLNFSNELKLSNLTDLIKNKEECIATFLAMLELVRMKEIYLKENGNNCFVILKR